MSIVFKILGILNIIFLLCIIAGIVLDVSGNQEDMEHNTDLN